MGKIAVPRVDALDLARHILWLRQGDHTTPLHLQKLIYFCHGWVLGYYNEPLIQQPEEAWEHGPVVATVYHEFKDFGSAPIQGAKPLTDTLGPDLARFVERVESTYRSFSPWELVQITHRPGSPWFRTVQQYGYGAEIPNRLIRGYFESRRRKS